MKAKHTLRALIIAGAVSASLALGAGPGLANTVQESRAHATHPQLVSSPVQVGGGALSPSTGNVTLSGAAHYGGTPASSSGDDCYVKTEKNRRFKGYKPWHTTEQGKSYFADWLDQLYSVSHARYLVGEGNTFQVQFCTEGGGNTDNGYHQWFNGEILFYKSRQDSKIKWIWGKGASSGGSVSTTLSFSVAAGPVNIGASTTVTTGVGSYDGDFGPDGLFTRVPKIWARYVKNRINTYFISPHTWPWDGTSSFEGNTGQVVYEWPMHYANTHTLTFEDGVQVHGFCAAVLGCSTPWQ